MNSRAEKLIALIKLHEGFSPRLYPDRGAWSIGYGHNCTTGPPLSREAAEHIMLDDLDAAWQEVSESIPWFRNLDDVRQAVLADMSYNMGVRVLLRFVMMIDALGQRDYHRAAAEMLNSQWATQVGERARRLARMMETGQWAPEVSSVPGPVIVPPVIVEPKKPWYKIW